MNFQRGGGGGGGRGGGEGRLKERKGLIGLLVLQETF